jgi:Head domain of trimeric autotransporter adhesin
MPNFKARKAALLSCTAILSLGVLSFAVPAAAQTVDPPGVASGCVQNAAENEFACGPGATTVGSGPGATVGNATAVGATAKATGARSTSVGASATAIGDDATSVGASASAADVNATAFGSAAQATGRSSTAIGSGGVASRDVIAAAGFSTAVGTGSQVAAGATGGTAVGDRNTITGAGSFGTAIGAFNTVSGASGVAIGNAAHPVRRTRSRSAAPRSQAGETLSPLGRLHWQAASPPWLLAAFRPPQGRGALPSETRL